MLNEKTTRLTFQALAGTGWQLQYMWFPLCQNVKDVTGTTKQTTAAGSLSSQDWSLAQTEFKWKTVRRALVPSEVVISGDLW